MVGEMLDGSHAYLLAGEALGKLCPRGLWVRWKGTCPDLGVSGPSHSPSSARQYSLKYTYPGIIEYWSW